MRRLESVGILSANVNNQALLLSHPRPMIRDTQHLAGKHKVVKSKYVALRNLVKQELDITIQAGEHSSVRHPVAHFVLLHPKTYLIQVTDARATMAVFRLHRKEWEKEMKPMTRKRLRAEKDDDDKDALQAPQASMPVAFPGGGRKGVSSGLATVVRRRGGSTRGSVPGPEKKKWWKELVGDAKGSIKVRSS